MTQDTKRDAGLMAMKAVATSHLAESVSYTFTGRERSALKPFFSNTDRKVFFMYGLPTAVTSALLAMYSRLKNPRGLRGHFVDNLVPLLMLCSSDEAVTGPNAEYKVYQRELKDRGLTTLDAVCDYDAVWRNSFARFLESAADPAFWRVIAESGKVRDFLSKWLDAYGHNSIARTAHVVVCVEECSILTAKSLEWSRPGAGYIELSTRYVDFSGKSLYPVWDEIAAVDGIVPASRVHDNADEGMRLYRELMGDNVDGLFPTFLREEYGGVLTDAKQLEAAVLGESCDVLGNLLPCATLTSVGMALSGETFSQVLKHLALDGTPENLALIDTIMDEAGRAGVGHFIRHWEPTEWDRVGWVALRQVRGDRSLLIRNEFAARSILTALDRLPGIHAFASTSLFDEILPRERGDHEKLPRAFETVSAMFDGTMSFRGWRDLHRMGFCMHQRALVTPELGFYGYPKPAPPELLNAFTRLHSHNQELYRSAQDRMSPNMLQYGMAMGNLVRYQLAANLREMEFCNWQRSKWSVNDEVREQFLTFENALRNEYPWWARISRADTTPHYAFARGVKMVL